MKIPPIGSPVKVDWFDSVDQTGWHYYHPEEPRNFGLRLPMITRGVLVAQDGVSLSVASTVAPAGAGVIKEGYMDVLSIPRGCVVSVKVIP